MESDCFEWTWSYFLSDLKKCSAVMEWLGNVISARF